MDHSNRIDVSFVKTLFEVQPSTQTTPWAYSAHTDDFGNIKRSVLVSYGPPDPNEPEFPKELVFETLKEIGAIEGFEVIPTKVFYFVRDAKVRCMDGSTYLRTSDIDDKIKSTALNRMGKREKHLQKNHSLSMTTHPLIQGGILGKGIVEGKNHRRAGDGFIVRESYYDDSFKKSLTQTRHEAQITPSRVAWEGGNVSASTNLQGRVKVLIGEDLLTVAHQILRQAGYFKFEKGSRAYTEECGICCTFYLLKDELNKMFMRREFPTLVEELTPELKDEEILDTGHEMNAMGLINKFKPEITEELRKITGDYLGQRAFVRNVLWPKELQIDSADIQVIKQADYHLDVFLKPGPRGSIFLQSFDKTIQLLKEIEVNAKTLGLTPKDLKILETLLTNANQLTNHLEPLFKKIREQITEAGFKIIETPGTFYGKESGKDICVNFINALSGWSPLTKRYYYVSLGASLGDRLGKVLMETFRVFMEHYASPVAVHYIGYDPKNKEDFSRTSFFQNRIQSRAGVHCLTFELKTEAHTEEPALAFHQ